MPTTLENFPLANLADGIISYIQWIFGNPEVTPDAYRWNKDDRQSRIVISGPYTIDKEKPMSSPYIVVERTNFRFENRTIDNLKSGQENVFQETDKVVIADGGLSINIGSQVASEASSIANFLAIQLQADRHGIISTLGFVRNLNIESVSPETPGFKDSEIKRWNVVLNVSASLQMGWRTFPIDGDKWEKLSLRAIDTTHFYESSSGNIMTGRDTIIDPHATFGFENTDKPQLLEKEFDKGWYYVLMEDDPTETYYDVIEIVNDTELRLGTRVENFDPNNKQYIEFTPEESKVNVKYKLLWNSVHLHVELPGKGE